MQPAGVHELIGHQLPHKALLDAFLAQGQIIIEKIILRKKPCGDQFGNQHERIGCNQRQRPRPAQAQVWAPALFLKLRFAHVIAILKHDSNNNSGCPIKQWWPSAKTTRTSVPCPRGLDTSAASSRPANQSAVKTFQAAPRASLETAGRPDRSRNNS